MGAAFTECIEGKGGHLNPDLLILEVVDDNGNLVENGALGEVVITTLGVEGMPLIRYKTGDLCNVHYDVCSCGRTSTRLGPVLGRKQQMIKFKGTTIFPLAIFDVLDMMSEISIYQVEISKCEFGNDNITILLPEELENSLFIKKITSLFKSKLRVNPNYKFLSKEKLTLQIFKEDKRKPEKLIYM
jgi:phenylacetate-CoA ligase